MCCYFIFKQTNKKLVHSRLSLRKSCILTLSPDRLSLLLLSRKPIQLKTRSACVLVAGTQRNFLASLTRFGYPKENNHFVPKYDLSTNILAAD